MYTCVHIHTPIPCTEEEPLRSWGTSEFGGTLFIIKENLGLFLFNGFCPFNVAKHYFLFKFSTTAGVCILKKI